MEGEKGRVPPRVGSHPMFEILKNTLGFMPKATGQIFLTGLIKTRSVI